MIETVPLGEVAHIFNGKTPSKAEKRSVGHPVLKIKDVDDRGVFCGEFDSFVDDSFAQRYRHKAVQTNDVLILNAAHNSDYVGSKMLQAPPEVQGSIATGEWLMARSASAKLDQGYMWHWFQSPPTRDQIRGKVKGIHLYPRDVAELLIPVPTPDEQHRIAAILGKADAIRRKREKELALADDFLRSAYLNLVGLKHPSYQGWEPASIESLAEDKRGSIRSGPFGSALLHSEFVDAGIAVLGIDNAVKNKFQWAERRFITDEKYKELRRYRVYPKDVIITIMGTTGRSAVVPDDIPEAITTKHLASITCDLQKILPEVLSFAIHSDPVVIDQIRAANKGAIMDGLNLGIIRQIKLRMPPMRQQRLFADVLQKTHAAIQRTTTPSGDGSELYSSLSQRAFRGEL